ncbi:RND transporter [Alicyclobacillus tengchongensis]|nr:RND transporter [Alicyclobacillus tengchongensis]
MVREGYSKRRKLVFMVILCVIVIAGLVSAVFWRSRHALVQVQTASVQLQHMQRVTISTGDVRPVNRQIVDATSLPQPVAHLYVAVGQHVHVGQPLLQLNTSAATLAVNQAQTAVTQAQLAYQRVLTQYQQAPAALKGLWLPQVDAAQSTLVQAQNQLAEAKAQLNQLTITASVTGIVLIASANGLDAEGNQTPVVEVVSPSKQVVLELSEVDAAQIQTGMAVSMTTDAFPNQVFRGVVKQVAPFASVSASGTPQVQVLVAPQGTLPVPYGYQVNCRISSVTPDKVPTVPYGALVQEGTSYAVYVLRGNRVSLVPVKLGMTSDTAVQVISGLRPGQTVVVNPPDTLTNGEVVKPT